MAKKITTGIVPKEEHIKELSKEAKRQLRQDRSFRKLIIDSYANDGVKISAKEAMKIHKEYKKKSEEHKKRMREDYLRGAMNYRGYDLQSTGVNVTEFRDTTGKKDITEADFDIETGEEYPIEVKYGEKVKELKAVKKELKEKDKTIAELERRIAELEKKLK